MYNKFKLLLLCLAFGFTAFANNTNSPYSMLGYGELASSGLAGNEAMGGIGYGLRSNKMINTVNPASYSSVDSMTVMFDVGFSTRITHFKEGNNKAKTTNGNLDYIAFQMPLIRNMGLSFGFTPFSFVGYNVTQQETDPSGIVSNSAFVGTGGINQLYGGLAYQIGERLSVGAEINYAFGSIKHRSAFDVYVENANHPTDYLKNLKVNDVSLRYGIQAKAWETDEQTLTIGATYKHKSVLDGTFEKIETNTDTDTESTTTHTFDLPTIMGGGVYYSYKNSLSAGVDYTREQWADTRFYSEKNVLYNVNRFAAGVSYVPNQNSRFYYNRIRYSAGASVANSYVLNSANNYTASVGLGFPLRSAKTYLNTVFEYGNNKVNSSSALQEEYFKFTLSASISELWFHKRRLD